MKNFLKKIPFSVKILVLLNLVFYFIILLFDFFGFDVNTYLGLYNFKSDNFFIPQLVTSIFCHDIVFDHILVNIILFFIFSFGIYRVYGNRGLIFTYLFGGIFSSLSFSIFMTDLNSNSIRYIKESGLVFEELPFEKNGQINSIDFGLTKDISNEQSWAINVFNTSTSYSVGSSGSISAIMMVFLLTFIFKIKKIFLNLIVISLVIITSIHYYEGYLDLIGTTVGHLGGFLGGIICFILLKIYRIKKEVI